jgi:acyl-CoA thioesterase-1
MKPVHLQSAALLSIPQRRFFGRMLPAILFPILLTAALQVIVSADNPASSPAVRPSREGKLRTVVVFGDSITAGSMLAPADRGKAWPQVVENESHGTLRMINEGKGGRPSASLAEFDEMLKRQSKPDLLVIALGMNDSRDITPDCVPKAVANIRAMIMRCRQTWGPKTPVLIVGPTNINKGALGPTKNIGKEREAKIRELGDAFAVLARELSCDYISLFGSVPDTSLTADGVHPNVVGNAAIAAVMFSKLNQ